MYENQTEEVVLKRMFEKISSSIDKREGSVIYDACMPTAIEVMLLYAMCDFFLKNTFGDTAEREYLIERAMERGLSPTPATYAEVQGEFTPASLEIPIGTRFSYDELNYIVTKKISAGVYRLRCETTGTVGNKPSGTLLPIDYVQGLQTAALAEVIVPGEDEEDTEVFRARYLASFDSSAYGGNIADYRQKVGAIAGVGGVKVYPVWAGGGTVRITFTTSEHKPPASEFVSQVQTLIDPVTNSGEGVGIAPIGHSVTVEGAKNSAIEITLHLTLAETKTISEYETAIEEVIDGYFSELNETWQDTQKAETNLVSNTGLTVRIAQIESRILDIDGIIDIQHTSLNGAEENLVLDVDELAVRGAIVYGD